MPRNLLNEKPFEHRSYHGTLFKAARCDFVGGVDVHVPSYVTEAHLVKDTFELGWFHAMNIAPNLNGFSGTDQYRIHRE